MVRSELYEDIKAKIQEVAPEVQHIDLWNHNVEFIEQEDAWSRPAVFVEFDKISWSPFQGGRLRGTGMVNLHIVTDWNEGGHQAAFALCQKISAELEGMSGEDYNGMVLTTTVTNHNHEEILESIDGYAVRFMR